MVQSRAARAPGETAGGQGEALLPQVGDQVGEPAALDAEEIACRDPAVVEEQFGGVLGVQPDLVEVPAPGESGRPVLDDDQAHAPVGLGRVGLDGHHHQIGVDPVGDERLGTVEDELVAVPPSRGGDRGEVRTGGRLGHGDGEHEVAPGHAGEPPAGLLLGGVVQQVGQGDVIVEGEPEGGRVHPHPVEFLGEHQVEAEVVVPPTAVLGGDGHGQEAVAARVGEHRSVDDPGPVPLVRVREHLLLHEAPEAGAELLVLVLEQTSSHGTPRLGAVDPDDAF